MSSQPVYINGFLYNWHNELTRRETSIKDCEQFTGFSITHFRALKQHLCSLTQFDLLRLFCMSEEKVSSDKLLSY